MQITVKYKLNKVLNKFMSMIYSDIDECVNGMVSCLNGKVCENILGSYQCISTQEVKKKCRTGFFKFAGKCIGT